MIQGYWRIFFKVSADIQSMYGGLLILTILLPLLDKQYHSVYASCIAEYDAQLYIVYMFHILELCRIKKP